MAENESAHDEASVLTAGKNRGPMNRKKQIDLPALTILASVCVCYLR